MDLYCVMGNPVEHSRSPWIHARFAELTGQTLDYGRRLAPLGRFRRRGRGVPRRRRGHGARLQRHGAVQVRGRRAGAAPDAARRAGAGGQRAELSRRRRAWRQQRRHRAGQRHPAVHAGVALAGSELLLLGAGGGAAGVLGPLLEAGPRRVVVANRTLAKAIALVQRHAALALQHHVTLEAQALDERARAASTWW